MDLEFWEASHDPEISGQVPSVDGANLSYRVYGEGIPVLFCNGLGCSTFYYEDIKEYFGNSIEMIFWDYRGHGKSDKPTSMDRFALHDLVLDGVRILDHLNRKDAVWLGHSMGSQVILEAFRQSPDRVKGLISVHGSYENPVNTFYDSKIPRHVFPYVSWLGMQFSEEVSGILRSIMESEILPTIVKYIGLNPLFTPERKIREFLDHFSRMELKHYMALAREMQSHSASNFLEDIDVPTLIVAGTNDSFTPIHVARTMKNRIPGAGFLEIPSGTHIGFVEQPELFNLRVEKFLTDHFGFEGTS